MAIINECLSMAQGINANVDFLSNGWLIVTRGSAEVYYERLSELHADLVSGRVNDYLLSVCE